jgi:hypothetical protein
MTTRQPWAKWHDQASRPELFSAMQQTAAMAVCPTNIQQPGILRVCQLPLTGQQPLLGPLPKHLPACKVQRLLLRRGACTRIAKFSGQQQETDEGSSCHAPRRQLHLIRSKKGRFVG